MTKIDTIRKALKSNPKVIRLSILGSLEEGNTYTPLSSPSYNVSFYVAPRGGLYTAKDLDEFMTRLVPGLEPTTVESFENCPKGLLFGNIYFSEKIGEEKKIITITDEEALSKIEELTNRKRTLEKVIDHKRKIGIEVFPDENMFNDIVDYKKHKNPFSMITPEGMRCFGRGITWEVLKKYKNRK